MRFGSNGSLGNFKKLKKRLFSLAAWCVHHKAFLSWGLKRGAKEVVQKQAMSDFNLMIATATVNLKKLIRIPFFQSFTHFLKS